MMHGLRIYPSHQLHDSGRRFVISFTSMSLPLDPIINAPAMSGGVET